MIVQYLIVKIQKKMKVLKLIVVLALLERGKKTLNLKKKY